MLFLFMLSKVCFKFRDHWYSLSSRWCVAGSWVAFLVPLFFSRGLFLPLQRCFSNPPLKLAEFLIALLPQPAVIFSQHVACG